MSVKITIGTTVINFPTSGTDANWAEPVVEFALAVKEQLNFVSQTYDLPPKVIAIPETGNVPLPEAHFPNGEVRSFILTYSIYKLKNDPTSSIAETGTLTGLNKGGVWILEREFSGDKKSDGTSYHDFTVDTDNQVILSCSTFVPGTGSYDFENSKIVYSAKTQPISQ